MNQSIKNSKHVVFSWGKKQDLEIINLNPMLQKQCMATSFCGEDYACYTLQCFVFFTFIRMWSVSLPQPLLTH